MCVENLPIHPQFWKTFPNPSTNGYPKFLLTKNTLIAQNKVYREALDKSGYRCDLSYKVTPNQTTRRTRQRNIIWHNPPYSRNVDANVGKCFFSLIDQHFPKSNPQHKISNRNTLKLSYGCMNNVKSIISSYNKTVINKSTNSERDKKTCNCRKPETCPMDGNLQRRKHNLPSQSHFTNN